ncbi:hypothetical protein FF36_03094 [Frankia torreyi]|uniref:FXSXX-COOH protein n=1 Tax=Frankia torreyi TaxID=1856 RepID=A0A0D8BEZ4_9ACTN|nr:MULTISPECIES: hypothetical protein [Frankia]KJE22564.1 hypothetical protein FF36_03094 [Frankia torreyi]KQM04605.1 hypothetical protein FF86_102431 [Frankia sp. CpI1-P]
MIDRDEAFESALPDLSEIDLADLADLGDFGDLGDRSHPRLRDALARLRQEAVRPADAMSGFTSSIRPGSGP